eukprot:COSAG05_NODE_2943_length_2479_cov_1.322269_3_plen_82_part_00
MDIGVTWGGCGNIFRSNQVYNAPQIGMIGHGVNNIFEDNYLHDLAQGSADTGGFYAGRSWTDRKTQIDYQTVDLLVYLCTS